MKKVLIVEDHVDIRKLIRMTLEFEDFEIHEAENALQGVAEAERLQPEVVLMDVMMPGTFDGLEACRRIKADPALRQTKVMLLTARSQSQDREAGLKTGADAYLVKPFSPLQLIETINGLQAA